MPWSWWPEGEGKLAPKWLLANMRHLCGLAIRAKPLRPRSKQPFVCHCFKRTSCPFEIRREESVISSRRQTRWSKNHRVCQHIPMLELNSFAQTSLALAKTANSLVSHICAQLLSACPERQALSPVEGSTGKIDGAKPLILKTSENRAFRAVVPETDRMTVSG